MKIISLIVMPGHSLRDLFGRLTVVRMEENQGAAQMMPMLTGGIDLAAQRTKPENQTQ